MRLTILKDHYFVVNLAVIAVIFSIFAYSLIFQADNRKHPIPSGSAMITRNISASTGLSRSFSEIVRINFTEAKSYNPYGIRIFSFFVIQLLMRILAIFITQHNISLKQRQLTINVDITLSVLLFVVFFWPFIALTAKQFI